MFGMAKVKHVRISAMLSGLKLEATLQNVNASATHRERVKGVLKRKSHETSATAHVGHAMIVLLEGEPPNMQYVSEYSTFSKFIRLLVAQPLKQSTLTYLCYQSRYAFCFTGLW